MRYILRVAIANDHLFISKTAQQLHGKAFFRRILTALQHIYSYTKIRKEAYKIIHNEIAKVVSAQCKWYGVEYSTCIFKM
jgi:hypothetical protein